MLTSTPVQFLNYLPSHFGNPYLFYYTPSSFSPLPGKSSNNGFNSHQRNSPDPGRSANGVKRTSRSILSTEAGVAAKRQKRQKNNGGQTLTRTEINARNQAMAVQRRDRAIETAHEKDLPEGAEGMGVVL
jgi:hypothetical protein